MAAAHAAGASWADVGGVLGVSRQAAFKRFATTPDPRTGAPMGRRGAPAVAALAERAFRLLADGDLRALRAMMTPDTAEVLDAGRIADTWARAVADTGPLVDAEVTGVRHPDGTPLGAGETSTGTLVGVVRLACEAGEWEGRAACDGDGRLTGLLLCAPGAGGLPF